MNALPCLKLWELEKGAVRSISICWSMESTEHRTTQRQEWNGRVGKTSRGALRWSKTLQALWAISRRIQGNGLHLHLNEKWETWSQSRETLPVKRCPQKAWAVLTGPGHLVGWISAGTGFVISFPVLSDLPFTVSFFPLFFYVFTPLIIRG